MKLQHVFSIVVLSFLIACSSPKKLIDNQQYDKAFEVSLKRLKKGKIKSDHLLVLEQAYAIIQERDMQVIHDLKDQKRTEHWPLIYKRYLKFDKRQASLTPVLKRLEKNGFDSNIRLHPLDAEIEEARFESARHFYSRGEEYVAEARQGNRQSARAAYGFFNRCQEYIDGFREASDLKIEMHELGVSHILIQTHLSEFEPDFDQELFYTIFDNKSFPIIDKWQVMHLQEPTDASIHYLAHLSIGDINVSRNNYDEDVCSNTKEIEVGTSEKQVWSEQDSAYITVEEPIYQDITVTVNTITQEKSSRVKLFYQVESLDQKFLFDEKRMNGSYSWCNVYSVVSGDSRALDSRCDDKGGCYEGYPSNGSMIHTAARNLRRGLFKELKKEID